MTPCREWQAAKSKGYGKKWDRDLGKVVLIHRWVVAQIHGWDAIKGKVVRHRCDNPACYRYDHLEVGTHSDNSRDMMDRRRGRSQFRKGENVTLSDSDVADIRANYAGTWGEQSRIAERYGVHRATITRILNGSARS